MLTDDDRNIFKQAMKGVTPLNEQARHLELSSSIKPFTKPSPAFEKPSFEYTHPRDDFYDNGNWCEANCTLQFTKSDLPARTLSKLKKGQIRFDRSIDLHGKTSEQALIALSHALSDVSIRCLLVIHGKSEYSGKPPILKNIVNQWLRTQSRVLAFHSASLKHGGNGALYLLLKQKRLS